jgi:hypothetical protein
MEALRNNNKKKISKKMELINSTQTIIVAILLLLLVAFFPLCRPFFGKINNIALSLLLSTHSVFVVVVIVVFANIEEIDKIKAIGMIHTHTNTNEKKTPWAGSTAIENQAGMEQKQANKSQVMVRTMKLMFCFLLRTLATAK